LRANKVSADLFACTCRLIKTGDDVLHQSVLTGKFLLDRFLYNFVDDFGTAMRYRIARLVSER